MLPVLALWMLASLALPAGLPGCAAPPLAAPPESVAPATDATPSAAPPAALPAAPPAALATASDAATSAEVEARREAILAVARDYATHSWTGSSENLLHGPDPDGIHVDTPDDTHREDGWAADGSPNVGVPYKWGGFASLDQFDEGIAEGLLAGQLTDGKRLDASRHAVGVDCSGFVARCWNLPFKQSTRSLGRLCFELESYDELRPGDLINKFDAHAMLFVEFTDETREHVRVIEATLPKVLENEYPADKLAAAGFRPYRYKPLDDRWARVARGESEWQGGEDGGVWTGAAAGTGAAAAAGAGAEAGAGAGAEAGAGAGADADADADADAGADAFAWRTALASLPDGLASSVPGDWVRLHAGNDEYPRALGVTRVVAAAGRDGVELQSETRMGGMEMQTLEEHAARAALGDRLLAVRDEGQPLDELTLVSGSLEAGHFELGARSFPGHRVELVYEGSMLSRGNTVPLTIRLEAVLSPEVPLEGLLTLRRETEYGFPSGPVTGAFRYELAAFGRSAGVGQS